MNSFQVLQVIQLFNDLNVKVWIAGGWAVDALVGKQTRDHNDLDLAFDANDEDQIIAAISKIGFSIADDTRPTRFVLKKNDGTEIDMHPVVFDILGVGRQIVPNGNDFIYPIDAFSVGTIAGSEVNCLSANQLIQFHKGYLPLEKDKHNMRVIHEKLGIELPIEYKTIPE